MSRQLRLEFPGALFHVTSRGNERRDIFRDDIDRRVFLELLGKAVHRFDWILLAYVLMSNHFHLLLRLTAETLSRGMQWLNGEYARRFNRRHGRVGHLIQGRPWCVLVEEERYLREVLRYVVLNPVRAGMVETPEAHSWSSHRAVIGDVPEPDWLAIDDVLSPFGRDRASARLRYRQFVHDAIHVSRSPFEDVHGQMYLGSNGWIEGVRDKIALKPRSDDHPRLQREARQLAMADVIAAVAGTWATDPDIVRQGRGGVPRMVAAWLGCYEALLTHRQIAAGLRIRSATQVSRLVECCEGALRTSAVLRQCVDRAVSTMRGKKGKG